MLVNSKKLFKAAQEQHFAIPSANFLDMESIKLHIAVAEELNLPLIVAIAESHLGDNMTLEDAALVGRKYAKEASVPVVLHLDHGESFETCKKAVDLGFTSVMIDASQKSFDENVEITKKVVEYAHSKGVVVEAEIGHVASNFNENDTETLYTTADEAKAFAEASGCDSLAISIGTAHGVYKAKAIPEISFDALAAIRKATDTPLVLHGGSGSGDDNLRRCAREGICKVNVYTDLYLAAMDAAGKSGAKDYLSLRAAIKQGMADCLKHYYSVFETKTIAEGTETKKADGPFLVVNPKSYLYGEKSLELALAADQVAADTGLTVYFTCPYADIRMIKKHTTNIIVCAQSLDPLKPGRGMGHVLPESLYEAGARAVFLNHAENCKTVADLNACIKRAKEIGMTTIVCADSTIEAKAVACMGADIVLAEPTDLIGTGQVAEDSYTTETVKALHEINPDVLVMIASGVSTADDCYNVVKLGADGTGATSGILNAPSPALRVREMAEAIVKAGKERGIL